MKNLVATLAFALFASAAWAQDKYVDYYYPAITSTEVFDRVVRQAPLAGKAVRVEFVNNLTTAQLRGPKSPGYIMFAKGDDAKHLIIVAQNDDVFKTLYRARATMAQLTSNVRSGGFFRQQELQLVATFYDLLQLMQFDTLVLTDGENWSHKVEFKRN